MSISATVSPAQGVYAALVTPRRRDTIEADTAAYLDYIDKVSASGVDGLVFFGSTGEFIHFDIEERMRVAGLAVKRCRLPVLVNVSHSTFSGVRNLADHAIDTGAQGLLVMSPYFYPYADGEIESFYQAVAAAVDGRLPIYLYNLPQFTSALSPELLTRLLSSGAYAGVKDSSGDWKLFERLHAVRERYPFQLFVGHERIYAEALQNDVDGLVSGIAAAVPELPVAMQRAVRAGDFALCSQLATRVHEFLGWIDKFPTTVLIKEAAEARQWIRSTVASPLSEQKREELIAFRSWFEVWLLETLTAAQKAPVKL